MVKNLYGRSRKSIRNEVNKSNKIRQNQITLKSVFLQYFTAIG